MILVQMALLLAVAIIAVVYFLKPQATLRVTTGPGGSAVQRFISALVKVATAEYPRFDLVQVNDLVASSKALEDGKVDLGIVRTDVATPLNSHTIAILRREVIVFRAAARLVDRQYLGAQRQDGRHPAELPRLGHRPWS
jgi:DNA-binding transcriptional LysR family regulator